MTTLFRVRRLHPAQVTWLKARHRLMLEDRNLAADALRGDGERCMLMVRGIQVGVEPRVAGAALHRRGRQLFNRGRLLAVEGTAGRRLAGDWCAGGIAASMCFQGRRLCVPPRPPLVPVTSQGSWGSAQALLDSRSISTVPGATSAGATCGTTSLAVESRSTPPSRDGVAHQ